MVRVISQFFVGKYTVLKLDNEIPRDLHTKYEIEGICYDAVPIYDAERCIAIASQGEFVGKEVVFI